jgi:hypothetical protein
MFIIKHFWLILKLPNPPDSVENQMIKSKDNKFTITSVEDTKW